MGNVIHNDAIAPREQDVKVSVLLPVSVDKPKQQTLLTSSSVEIRSGFA